VLIFVEVIIVEGKPTAYSAHRVDVDWNLFQYLQLDTSYKRPEKFKPHQCGPRCVSETQDNHNRLKGQNPLIIPLLCRWER
jgi:hypothetical protein